MFDTRLIITLFLLASLLACLLILRLSINIKHVCLFSFITDINELFEVSTPSASHFVEMESVICLYFHSTLLTLEFFN